MLVLESGLPHVARVGVAIPNFHPRTAARNESDLFSVGRPSRIAERCVVRYVTPIAAATFDGYDVVPRAAHDKLLAVGRKFNANCFALAARGTGNGSPTVVSATGSSSTP